MINEMGEFCKDKKVSLLLPCMLELSLTCLKTIKENSKDESLQPYKNIISAFLTEALKVI